MSRVAIDDLRDLTDNGRRLDLNAQLLIEQMLNCSTTLSPPLSNPNYRPSAPSSPPTMRSSRDIISRAKMTKSTLDSSCAWERVARTPVYSANLDLCLRSLISTSSSMTKVAKKRHKVCRETTTRPTSLYISQKRLHKPYGALRLILPMTHSFCRKCPTIYKTDFPVDLAQPNPLSSPEDVLPITQDKG